MISNLLPPSWREAFYRQRFLANTHDNLFMGSYGSFEEAEASAPASKPIGYDHAEAADLYKPQLYHWDYPALFWIGQSFKEGLRNVFDLGGHVGVKFYAFSRVLGSQPDVRWQVCDVPRIVDAGREIAQKRQAAELAFCTDFREASGCDVLLASGSLQYLPTPIGTILSALPRKPKRIVLNATAVHPKRTLYTLNSIVVAVCPYRIQHWDELQRELKDAGYRRADSWRNEGKPIHIPFVPDGDEPYYAGGCWDRA
jgi:putative methyltransferase (TIGR04325 family)